MEPAGQRRYFGQPRRGRLRLLALRLAQRREVDSELRSRLHAHPLPQPVAQRERRAAILLVIGTDRLQQRGLAALEPVLIGHDRATALTDRGLRADEAVMALEVLERIALLADLEALADDAVEVNQHLPAQQLIDLL